MLALLANVITAKSPLSSPLLYQFISFGGHEEGPQGAKAGPPLDEGPVHGRALYEH